jgi:hypothetical protein
MMTQIPFNPTMLMTLRVSKVTIVSICSRMLHYGPNGMLVIWQFKHSIGLNKNSDIRPTTGSDEDLGKPKCNKCPLNNFLELVITPL